ncbi:zinc carboxypeptidase [Kordia sp. SMS9]|uniref:M14 family metallopeptidase n=1 Tax=Kordia sp. SMS9 TaxID=2282170 RepID=UPI000E0D7A66|nr:M14 family metallopeptidase [Kordia sp. SMS9]AXG70077.1 zinc carboxypeptidase [Kordia sp. SMS9]
MKKLLFICCISLFSACSSEKKETKTTYDFTTTFEKSGGTQTPTYAEVIAFYENLAEQYDQIHIETVGLTDSGKPLHLVTYNPDGNFDFENIRKEKIVLLVNNGIHPGESDGIDATMMLLRDLANGTKEAPKNVVISAIPVYNVGGSLNRNSGTRANQNGPEAYGFRGNAQNYDLNRDFIKSDTRNAKAFAEIFHKVQPDVFVDNHVSNGADYQYTLTHLFTQHNKLGHEAGTFLHETMMPDLEATLLKNEWDITPYVNVFGRTPDSGFSQFMDSPRYSTGYTTLFNTLGLMVETHMLKPYKQRVEGTYALMDALIENIETKQHSDIKNIRKKTHDSFVNAKTYPVQWTLDREQKSVLNFKGFEGEFVTSELTGQKRLKYDSNKPFTKDVDYFNYFKATKEVTVPKAYIIPQGWHNVIELLKLNKVTFETIKKDTIVEVEVYHIKDFKTHTNPYEGHYPHYNTEVTKSTQKIGFRKGDFIANTNQTAFRYLLETLEPEAVDSFFNWNFFDTILQQKEGFSAYVFEDEAKELLQNNPDWKAEFEQLKASDETFANSARQQLRWIYMKSNHYEKAHLRYPIFRIAR